MGYILHTVFRAAPIHFSREGFLFGTPLCALTFVVRRILSTREQLVHSKLSRQNFGGEMPLSNVSNYSNDKILTVHINCSFVF